MVYEVVYRAWDTAPAGHTEGIWWEIEFMFDS